MLHYENYIGLAIFSKVTYRNLNKWKRWQNAVENFIILWYDLKIGGMRNGEYF